MTTIGSIANFNLLGAVPVFSIEGNEDDTHAPVNNDRCNQLRQAINTAEAYYARIKLYKAVNDRAADKELEKLESLINKLRQELFEICNDPPLPPESVPNPKTVPRVNPKLVDPNNKEVPYPTPNPPPGPEKPPFPFPLPPDGVNFPGKPIYDPSYPPQSPDIRFPPRPEPIHNAPPALESLRQFLRNLNTGTPMTPPTPHFTLSPQNCTVGSTESQKMYVNTHPIPPPVHDAAYLARRDAACAELTKIFATAGVAAILLPFAAILAEMIAAEIAVETIIAFAARFLGKPALAALTTLLLSYGSNAAPVTVKKIDGLPESFLFNGRQLTLTDAKIKVNFYRKNDHDRAWPLNPAPLDYCLYVDDYGNPYVVGIREGAFESASFTRELQLGEGKSEIIIGEAGRKLNPPELKRKLWALTFAEPPENE